MKKVETFQFINEKWVPINNSQHIVFSSEIKCARIATYNVLCSNFWLERKISSDIKRYNYQINHLLPDLDVDILGLNEVSKNYVDILMKSDWAKKYYISDPNNTIFEHSNGNLIISKFKMRCFSLDHIIKGRIMAALIEIKDQSFLIISAHLSGYEENIEKRKVELQNILQSIKTYENVPKSDFSSFERAVLNNNIIIMGDLNLHNFQEEKLIEMNGYVDLWTETSKNDPGYTWDSLKNCLINVRLPFDNRRMRLDRILLKEGSLLFDIKENEKMKIFGTNLIDKGKIWSYLNSSDHFGLFIELLINEGQNLTPYKTKAPKICKITIWKRFRGYKTIIFYRVLTCILISLLIYFLINKIHF